MSKELINQYKQLHKKSEGYGCGDPRLVPLYKGFLKGREIGTVLDYGCGKSSLLEQLEFKGEKFYYDPAIEGKDVKFWEKVQDFTRFDLVICNDVLEHIPELELPELLIEIDSISKVAIFTIHCEKSRTVLPNGTNAHVTVHGKDWWMMKLRKYWNSVVTLNVNGNKFTVICSDTKLREEFVKDHAI